MLTWLTPLYNLKVFTALGTYRICNNLLKLLHYSKKNQQQPNKKNRETACFRQCLKGMDKR